MDLEKYERKQANADACNCFERTMQRLTNKPHPSCRLALCSMEVLVREYEVSRQHVGLSSPDGLLVRQCQGTSTATKRPRLAPQSDREDVPTEEGSPSLPEEMEGPANGDAGNGDVGDNASAGQDLSATPRQVVVTKPVVEGRGHTGYLTFARKAVPL